jgi:hypothetical protein
MVLGQKWVAVSLSLWLLLLVMVVADVVYFARLPTGETRLSTPHRVTTVYNIQRCCGTMTAGVAPPLQSPNCVVALQQHACDATSIAVQVGHDARRTHTNLVTNQLQEPMHDRCTAVTPSGIANESTSMRRHFRYWYWYWCKPYDWSPL